MRLRPALLLPLITPLLLAQTQAPSPVVERTVQLRDRTVRVSLFDNRAAVMKMHTGDEQVLLRRILLDESEFEGYLAALQRDAVELADLEEQEMPAAGPRIGVVTLYIGPGAPREIRYDTMAVSRLALSRLTGALDDIEQRILDSHPAEEEINAWQPQVGDRVLLFNGNHARVVEVDDNGTLVLEHDDTYIKEHVAPGNRLQVIREIEP